MAKSTGLTANVNLGGKKKLPISKSLGAEKINKIARKLDKKDVKEKTTRITLDIPENTYKKLKIAVAVKGETLRGYFLNLLNEDLNE